MYFYVTHLQEKGDSIVKRNRLFLVSVLFCRRLINNPKRSVGTDYIPLLGCKFLLIWFFFHGSCGPHNFNIHLRKRCHHNCLWRSLLEKWPNLACSNCLALSIMFPVIHDQNEHEQHPKEVPWCGQWRLAIECSTRLDCVPKYQGCKMFLYSHWRILKLYLRLMTDSFFSTHLTDRISSCCSKSCSLAYDPNCSL